MRNKLPIVTATILFTYSPIANAENITNDIIDKALAKYCVSSDESCNPLNIAKYDAETGRCICENGNIWDLLLKSCKNALKCPGGYKREKHTGQNCSDYAKDLGKIIEQYVEGSSLTPYYICKACPSGTTLKNGNCVMETCPAGQYMGVDIKLSTNQDEINDYRRLGYTCSDSWDFLGMIQPGTCTKNAAGCFTCPAGYYCPGDNNQYKCDGDAGYWAPAGSSKCKSCNEGKYVQCIRFETGGFFSSQVSSVSYGTHSSQECQVTNWGYKSCCFSGGYMWNGECKGRTQAHFTCVRRNPNTTTTFKLYCDSTTGHRYITIVKDYDWIANQCWDCTETFDLEKYG